MEPQKKEELNGLRLRIIDYLERSDDAVPVDRIARDLKVSVEAIKSSLMLLTYLDRRLYESDDGDWIGLNDELCGTIMLYPDIVFRTGEIVRGVL